jgi:hypothetical protein
MTIVTLVSGCGNAYPGEGTRDGGRRGGRWVSPMSGRDIRRLVALHAHAAARAFARAARTLGS